MSKIRGKLTNECLVLSFFLHSFLYIIDKQRVLSLHTYNRIYESQQYSVPQNRLLL